MSFAMLAERIVIGNDLGELRRMSQWIRDIANAVNLPNDMAFALDYCANEAVTNIISYAYEDSERHDIELELTAAGQGARLVIRDDGKPFNAPQAPEYIAPSSLADAHIGGLGIHLMRKLMAHCDYRREGNFNVLSLETQQTNQTRNA